MYYKKIKRELFLGYFFLNVYSIHLLSYSKNIYKTKT
jgi:hypothetical protein